MFTFLAREKIQAIKPIECGSGDENKRFTGQPAVQFTSKKLIPPLAETIDIVL
jgi:hypothetical protein